MYSNGVSLSGGGGIWQGGLPILDNGNAFFFPGIGWAKDRYPDAMLGGYNNLQLHCSDNGGTRNAPLACSPADCSMPQINRLDCHVGSISGPNVYSDVVEGISIDITFYATGGNGNYVWNTDNHNNTTYSTGNSHTFTYGRPPGSGATHQIYLESGDLTHAYNGQGDPASGDDPSCTVNLTQI
jgi:hypothetical protein